MHAHKERPEWGSVYAQNEAMKDVLARCHKKTAVQVCTLTIMHCHLVSTCIHDYDCLFDYSVFDYLSLPFLHVKNMIRTLTDVYFRRLKINHDAHIIYLILASSRTGGSKSLFMLPAMKDAF